MNTDLVAVLPSGLVPTEGPCEKEQDSYDEGFVLPAHSEKPLQTIHSHPLDQHLRFFEEDHIYTFMTIPTETSVTSLAHQFEQHFVAQSAINGMKTSRSQAWPRYEYVLDPRSLDEAEWQHTRGILATCDGKTVATIPPHNMAPGTNVNAAKSVLQHSARLVRATNPEDFEYFTFERGMSDEEITTKWSRDGMRASHMGTDRHYLAECFFNGLPHRWWEPDMGVLYRFCREHLIPRGIVAYNTEKEIVCRDANVAGSIDLIVWDTRREVYHIIDFKRSNKLRSQLRGYGKMSEPFQHLDDSKGAGYALQTSIYQYILERDYGMRIGDRILLSLHAEQPFVTSVPYLHEETRYIMERRFARVRAQTAVMEADPEQFRCRMSNAPVVDAVRLDDGRVVMEKMARLSGESFTVADDVRREMEVRVGENVEEVAFDPGACTSWRRLMPVGGLPPFQE